VLVAPAPLEVFDSAVETQVNMQRYVKDGLNWEIAVTIHCVLNLVNSFVEMFLRAGKFIGNQEDLNVRLGIDSPRLTKWLPFYVEDNKGPERDNILHQGVGVLQQIKMQTRRHGISLCSSQMVN
jgi:hypothetical protein